MPTPISISFSPSWKVGLPAAGTVQLVSATPIERGGGVHLLAQGLAGREIGACFGGGADDLLDQEGAGHAAPAGGVGRVLDGDVVIGDDRGIGGSASRRAISKFIRSPE